MAQDKNSAAQLFRQAANQGYRDAFTELAEFEGTWEAPVEREGDIQTYSTMSINRGHATLAYRHHVLKRGDFKYQRKSTAINYIERRMEITWGAARLIDWPKTIPQDRLHRFEPKELGEGWTAAYFIVGDFLIEVPGKTIWHRPSSGQVKDKK